MGSTWKRWRPLRTLLLVSKMFQALFLPWLVVHHCHVASAVPWEEWWTYEGISGPAFWGLINPEWSLCSRGRRQSPINLEPSQLLFDPNLRPLHVDKHKVGGHLINMGQGLLFTVDNSSKPTINVTGGPLSYKYEFHQMLLHFGLSDEVGSEHTIANKSFPAELQIFSFNTQLYSTYSEALDSPNGIVALSVLIQIGDTDHSELSLFTDPLIPASDAIFDDTSGVKGHAASSTIHKRRRSIVEPGQAIHVPHFSLRQVLPETQHYLTYEGSSTTPACQETVTWIILNRPLYISKQQLRKLRALKQGNPKTSLTAMGNNFRPIQPTHFRPVRTNIDFTTKEEKVCATMHRDMKYRANTFWKP